MSKKVCKYCGSINDRSLSNLIKQTRIETLNEVLKISEDMEKYECYSWNMSVKIEELLKNENNKKPAL